MIADIRWPDDPVCPKCGGVRPYKMGGEAGRKGQYKCRDCRKKFTVRVGTIFEESPLPLWDWVYAISRISSSKKGISAHQLHRELEAPYQTAWFMYHRIREAMRDDGSLQLNGTVESDESFIGGKPRKVQYKGATSKQGQTSKTPVHVLVERDGRKRTTAITNVTANTTAL